MIWWVITVLPLGPEIIVHSLWKGVYLKLPRVGESLGSRNRKHIQKDVKRLL